MTLPELSACPFCGGEARLTNGGTGNYYVRCTACAANTDDGSREREQYRNTDIRKAELDPSTFAHPEEFQREPYNPWGMRLLLVWCVGAVILGGWAVVKLIEWVL